MSDGEPYGGGRNRDPNLLLESLAMSFEGKVFVVG
jgi:hypothetical protein